MSRFLSLNVGVPGDGGVNVFEFKPGQASDMLKSMMTKEDYDGAGILDRCYKLGSRHSPLFESAGMEFLWSEGFTAKTYIDIRLPQVKAAFKDDAELRDAQIKVAKIDILASKRGISIEAMIEEAIEKLVFFDAHCALCIRNTMTHEEFCQLHKSASDVIKTTAMSIFEELMRDMDTVFFLQEINLFFVSILYTLTEGLFNVIYNETGSTAIIYPISFKDVEEIPFPTEGETYLHEEICLMKHQNSVYISVHCSAKTKEESTLAGKTIYKNKEDQLLLLKQFIANLRDQGITVFFGGDFNQRINAPPTMFVFPVLETPTTSKERGAFQVQFKKINKQDIGSKDVICIDENLNVSDCRVRTLYKDGRAFCSYALDNDAAETDASLVYPHLMQCPNYECHFPDHFVVEVIL